MKKTTLKYKTTKEKKEMNNIHNRLISKQEVMSIVNNLLPGEITQINNIHVFVKAFMHKSFSIKDDIIDEEDNYCLFDKNYIEKQRASNERLEFLGDAFLNLATAEYLFEKFPGKNEGFLTKLRTKLVRDTQLSYLGNSLGFTRWILISSHVERISGRSNPKLIEDVFESFIAALYIDQGHVICKKFIFSCFDKYVNLEYLVNNNDNYKDILLRFFQTKNWTFPIYKNIYYTGDVYNRQFTTVVVLEKSLYKDDNILDDVISKQQEISANVKSVSETGYTELTKLMEKNYIICQAKGKTKKISEQKCSEVALEILKVPKNF